MRTHDLQSSSLLPKHSLTRSRSRFCHGIRAVSLILLTFFHCDICGFLSCDLRVLQGTPPMTRSFSSLLYSCISSLTHLKIECPKIWSTLHSICSGSTVFFFFSHLFYTILFCPAFALYFPWPLMLALGSCMSTNAFTFVLLPLLYAFTLCMLTIFWIFVYSLLFPQIMIFVPSFACLLYVYNLLHASAKATPCCGACNNMHLIMLITCFLTHAFLPWTHVVTSTMHFYCMSWSHNYTLQNA